MTNLVDSIAVSLRRLLTILLLDVFAACIAFALLIVAARGIGRGQAPPELLAQLHLTDCALPCWMGITPGQTSLDEAVQRLDAAYPQSVIVQPTQIFVEYLIDSAYGTAVLGVAQGKVDSILLNLADVNGLAVGDAAALNPTPTCIVNLPPLILIYDTAQGYSAVSAGGGAQARWRLPLDSIEVEAGSNVLCAALP